MPEDNPAAELSDAEHARVFTPGFIRRRINGAPDPVAEAKAERIAELKNDNQALSIPELEAARNRAVRQMVRRMFEMKPQEIMQCVEVLDAEISSKRVTTSGDPLGEKAKATRQEMIQKLQSSKVQK